MAIYRFFVFQPNGKIGTIPTVQCQIESKAARTDVRICLSLKKTKSLNRVEFFFTAIAISKMQSKVQTEVFWFMTFLCYS